ncbi:MAG: MotA/TolQ/ExbB proton channel family protein [Saprospiraceae bacterium]|nr:MAG: MotA/TolQ/ExbB proton channel family protein [Saprospiraceae bacterium]
MFQNLLFLQATDIERTTETQSVLDLLFSGGPAGVINVLVLIVMSIVALYIFLERYMTIKKAGHVDENFMNNIRANVNAGNIQAARTLCQNADTPVARMVEKGLARIGKPLRDIDAAIENVGNLEVFKLEKNLATIASIAGAAPMVGFLGTVTGMMVAFFNMAKEQNVTPQLLAGGIYQALITTAVGLIVGIFAFIAYNLLVVLVDKVVYKMERHTMEFMDLLQEPSA